MYVCVCVFVQVCVCVCVLVGGHALQMTNPPAHQVVILLIYVYFYFVTSMIHFSHVVVSLWGAKLHGVTETQCEDAALCQPQEDEKPEVLSLCHWDERSKCK